MPVRIRLARHGRRHRPFFWIVVADSRAPRDGKFIEKLGYYDPIPEKIRLHLDIERALYWLSKGAQPTESANSLLRKAGVYHLKFLLRGVEKGVHTRQEAFEKFLEWYRQKQQKIDLTLEGFELPSPSQDRTQEETPEASGKASSSGAISSENAQTSAESATTSTSS